MYLVIFFALPYLTATSILERKQYRNLRVSVLKTSPLLVFTSLLINPVLVIIFGMCAYFVMKLSLNQSILIYLGCSSVTVALLSWLVIPRMLPPKEDEALEF